MGADQPCEIGERECQFSGSEAYTSAKITAETALLPPLSDVRRLPISIGNFDRLGLLANTAYKEKYRHYPTHAWNADVIGYRLRHHAFRSGAIILDACKELAEQQLCGTRSAWR
ncbi:hypothetical protein [Aminobacter sp. Piv2-1]|uniref:hypothetical protein n=1 Tax=Aminobacter sp. Piv2-1 TaxID=3031122 RepID=UPI0030B4C951